MVIRDLLAEQDFAEPSIHLGPGELRMIFDVGEAAPSRRAQTASMATVSAIEPGPGVLDLLRATGHLPAFRRLEAALGLEDVHDQRMDAEPAIAVEFLHGPGIQEGV